MEDPLDSILVIGRREYLLENKLARPGHNRRLVSKVRMLEEEAVVLLVDANSVLDVPDGPVLGGELGVEVADIPLAVTPEFETVGHIPGAVLAEVKSVLPLVRVVRVATVTNVSLKLTKQGQKLVSSH